MNNRYLFRGKRVDNGEWIYGNFCCGNERQTLHDSIFVYDCETQSFENYDIIPETVGQCTGLKDKNGKLIFEGDICKHRSNCSGKFVISVVSYTDGHFLALVNEHSGFELSEKLEIIGNIHDNTELLEVEE